VAIASVKTTRVKSHERITPGNRRDGTSEVPGGGPPEEGNEASDGQLEHAEDLPADQSLEVEDRSSPGFAREMDEPTARGQPGAKSAWVLRGREKTPERIGVTQRAELNLGLQR
jgi:hypothetical protein